MLKELKLLVEAAQRIAEYCNEDVYFDPLPGSDNHLHDALGGLRGGHDKLEAALPEAQKMLTLLEEAERCHRPLKVVYVMNESDGVEVGEVVVLDKRDVERVHYQQAIQRGRGLSDEDPDDIDVSSYGFTYGPIVQGVSGAQYRVLLVPVSPEEATQVEKDSTVREARAA